MKKKPRRKGIASKATAAGETTCSDSNHYCEFHCSGESWWFIGESHGPEYECPTTWPYGPCTDGAYTCISPYPKSLVGVTRPLAKNSGDYVLVGGELHVQRSYVDHDHYCPPVLTLESAKESDPTLASLLEVLTGIETVVSVTVSIRARPRQTDGHNLGETQPSGTSAKKRVTDKAAPRRKKAASRKKRSG